MEYFVFHLQWWVECEVLRLQLRMLGVSVEYFDVSLERWIRWIECGILRLQLRMVG